MEVINLNFIPSGANPVAHASQFDEGRVTRFNLYDGSTVYTLDGTETITVSVRKPDGHIVTESVTNTSSTYVDIATTEQMTACAGDNLAQIKVEKGSDTIGFLNYILHVQKDPEDGGDPSESFVHNLETQIAAAVADQYDADSVIFDNAPTAGHGVGYVVTSEGTPDELEDLTDVTLTTPTSGEALVWDGSKWTNGTPDIDVSDLADVVITSATDDDILVYDNGQWVNKANPASMANFGPDYDENTTYNTGDKVIYNNLLYECNDDGVTGAWDATKWDSLTVAGMTDNNLPHYTGTPSPNSTAEAIGAKQDQLTVTDNTQTIATYGGTIAYRKYGNVVEVNGSSIGTSTNIATNTEPTLYTLPSGYRPKRQITVAGYRANSYKYDRMLGYTVKTNGEITVYAYDTITNGSFSVCYIVD